MVTTRKYDNFIVSALLIVCVIIFAGFIGDFYYDLNDDCLIKDILSGSYAGVPEAHNIQMLYPIGAFFSLFYRIVRGLGWYGIFLCLLQFGSFFLICIKAGQTEYFKRSSHLQKALFFLLPAGIMLGLFLPHFLFVQYTVTCALLSAAAAFLILTGSMDTKCTGIFFVLLLIVAYNIRSEMLLLTMPMVLVAVLIKWTMSCFIERTRHEKKELFIRYLNFLLAVGAGILICLGINKLACSSDEWREFVSFFNNRTELYDFQYIPEYEENKEFYESIGLSESEHQLLVNYNFGLDEEIDSELLGKIAAYAKEHRTFEKPLSVKLNEALPLYAYRLFHVETPKSYEYPMTDYPWNIVTILFYLFVLISILITFKTEVKKAVISVLLLALLFACRSTLWLYIMARGRDPIRITHPLYLVEILILLGILMNVGLLSDLAHTKVSDKKNRARDMFTVFTVICALAAFIAVPFQVKLVEAECERRESSMAKYDILWEYMEESPESLYLMDVYTSVSFATVTGKDEATYTEKIFDNIDNTEYNRDLLGGWACKSPVSQKKLKNHGYDSYEQALVSDGVYLVMNLDEDTEWIRDFYSDRGKDVSVTKKADVAEVFGIYEVRESNE